MPREYFLNELQMNSSSLPTAGIYAIIHRDGDTYVGSAINIHKRLQQHLYKLRKGSHDNKYLQSAWTAHSEAHFDFEILETCETESLREREDYWINLLQPSYNIQLRSGRSFREDPGVVGLAKEMRLPAALASELTSKYRFKGAYALIEHDSMQGRFERDIFEWEGHSSLEWAIRTEGYDPQDEDVSSVWSGFYSTTGGC